MTPEAENRLDEYADKLGSYDEARRYLGLPAPDLTEFTAGAIQARLGTAESVELIDGAAEHARAERELGRVVCGDCLRIDCGGHR